MEIKFIRPKYVIRNRPLLMIMRIFIFLLCTTVLGFNTETTLAQEKVTINSDKEVYVDEVFQLIINQTKYSFLYPEDLFKELPKVQLKKGTIRADKLIDQSISNKQFMVTLTNNNTIIIKAIKKQQTIVSGKVLDEQGVPLLGVTIQEKGSKNGTVTNFDGVYTINVANTGTLIFSIIGFEKVEIPVNGKSIIDVTLKENTQELGEVIVTALNIKKREKQLAYAPSQVQSKEIVKAPALDVSRNLYGKVAGLQVASNSGGPMNGVRLQIRGINSITGDNRPLIVMDGIPIYDNDSGYSGRNGIDQGSAISDINPEDVESISVLKGASASALYGSDAANGVILITTKRSSTTKGLGVTYRSTYQADRAVNSIDFQNEYGAGREADRWIRSPEADGTNVYYEDHFSFGPKMDGQLVRWWDGELRPYSPQPNNYDNIYKLGSTMTNTVVLEGGTKTGGVRASYTRSDYDGHIRGSEQAKNSYSITAHQKLNDRLTINGALNYYNIKNTNPPIRTDRFATFGVSRSARIDLLRDNVALENGFRNGSWPNVSSSIRDNLVYPLFWQMEQDNWIVSTNRIIANFTANYEIYDDLKLRLKVGTDYRNVTTDRSVKNINANNSGQYQKSTSLTKQDYYEGILFYDKKLNKDFKLNLNTGIIMREYNATNTSVRTDGGLIVPNWFSTGNSRNDLVSNGGRSSDRLNAIFGGLDLAFKDYLFIQATGRNDWSSRLPAATRSYFYPSLSSSFVISDAFELPNFIDYLKIRGNVGQTGVPGNRYRANNVYSYGNYAGGYTNSFSNVVPPQTLTSELKTEYEAGLDFKLFKNRLGLAATYFENEVTDQIINLQVAASSGASSVTANAGKLGNKGVELQLYGTPIQTNNFSWNVDVNATSIKNEVIELAQGLTELTYGSPWGVQFKARVGEPSGEIFVRKFKRDDNGNKILNAGGTFAIEDDATSAGSAPAKVYGGFTNEFNYKNFSLNFVVNYSFGALLVSQSNAGANAYGKTKATLFGRDEEKGGLAYYVDAGQRILLPNHNTEAPNGSSVHHDGILPDGVILNDVTGEYEQNTSIVLPAYIYYYYKYVSNAGEEAILKNDYLKLRELSLSYNFPSKTAKKVGFQKLSMSVIGRNLFYIYKTAPNIDPESTLGTGGSSAFFEYLAYPTTRSFGLTLNASF